jgi:hypothetical protein
MIIRDMRLSQRCRRYLYSFMFVVLLWRWKQHVPPKYWYLSMTLLGLRFGQLRNLHYAHWITRNFFLQIKNSRNRELMMIPGLALSACKMQSLTFIRVCFIFRRLSLHDNHSRLSEVLWRNINVICGSVRCRKVQPMFCVTLGKATRSRLAAVFWSLSRADRSVTERSKTRICGRSLAGIAGSNPAEGMDVCVVCVVQYWQKVKARTIWTQKYG